MNKQKRQEWNGEYDSDNFTNVIWAVKCSVQMESHRRFCCRKRGELPKPMPRLVYIIFVYNVYIYHSVHVSNLVWFGGYMCKGIQKHHFAVSFCRPKHPTKVHVWAGIGTKGRTRICIFDGIMKKVLLHTDLGSDISSISAQ